MKCGKSFVAAQRAAAMFVTAGTLVWPASQGSTQPPPVRLKTPPIVTAIEAPAGTETLPVKWVRVAVPNLGVMQAAVARPSGPGPFPAVLVLHGTHGLRAAVRGMGSTTWRAVASLPWLHAGFQAAAVLA